MSEQPRNPAGLILFVLGAAQVPPEPPLPGAALVALLGDLGLSEGAARSAILRMRRGGWLVSQRTGRTVAYSPSDQVLAGHRRRADSFRPGHGPWDGWFHALLVSVPEQRRAFRDELRRAAHLAGYATLRPGLLVAASDRRAELDDLLTRIPPGASVVAGRLELGLGESRRVANELWDLEDLGHRFRSLAAFSRAAAKSALGGSLTGSEAFGAFAAATLPIYTAVADDPGLPAELLPAHWPAPELGAALGEALQAFGPPVTAHIADLRSIAQRRIPSTALR